MHDIVCNVQENSENNPKLVVVAMKKAKSQGDHHAHDCLCGLDIAEHEYNSDIDLPPASGGVGQAPEQESTDPEAGECAINPAVDEQTPDHLLPVASGGH